MASLARSEVTPRFEQLREQAGSYHLPVSIKNNGEKTAEELRVEVSMPAGDGGRESAEVRIQFLAGGETANAVVVFDQAPSRDNVAVDVISYLQPN